MAKDGKIRSFRKGWQHVRPVDMPQLRTSIMKLLGINNRNSWGMCLGRGFKMYDLQAAAIEREFAKCGVPNNMVWDDPKEHYEVVVLEATGTVQLYNKLTKEKQIFDSIGNLLAYVKRMKINVPTLNHVRFE